MPTPFLLSTEDSALVTTDGDRIVLFSLEDRDNTLNFTPCQFEINVGGFDVTPYVVSLSLARSRADISRPLIWEGEMRLDCPAAPNPSERGMLFGESLDDFENEERWYRGNHPVVISVKGKRIITVRISGYEYNEDDCTAIVRLTDLLGLLDYLSPPQDYKGLGYTPCRSVPVDFHIRTLLLLAGFPCIKTSMPGLILVAPSRISGSYVQEAQKYCGERGYWLYLDPDECVRTIQYGGNLAQAIVRSRHQIDRYERERSPELPHNKITVTATGEKYHKCSGGTAGDNITIEEKWGIEYDTNGLIRKRYLQYRRTEEVLFRDRWKKHTKIKIEQSRLETWASANKTYPWDPRATLLTEVQNEYKYYDIEGRLVRREVQIDKLLGLVLPDDFPINETFILAAEYIEEIWKPQILSDVGFSINVEIGGTGLNPFSDDVLRYHRRIYETLFPIGFRSQGNAGTNERTRWIRKSKEVEIEYWLGGNSTEKGCHCDEFKYGRRLWQRGIKKLTIKIDRTGNIGRNLSAAEVEQRQVGQTKYWEPGELSELSEARENKEGDRPPDWEYNEPECPICEFPLKAETRWVGTGAIREADPFGRAYNPLEKRETEYGASTLNTQAECDYLAQLIARMERGRYRARLCNYPMERCDEWIIDPTPFRQLLAHNGSYIADGDTLSLTTTEFDWSTVGNLETKIAPIPDPPPVDVFVPPPLSGNTSPDLAIASIYRVGFVGIDFPHFRIQPYGGTGTYSYAIAGLPPGIELAENLVFGRATTAGTYAAILTVSDGTDSITVDLTIEIRAYPSGAPTEAETKAVQVGFTYTALVRIDELFDN